MCLVGNCLLWLSSVEDAELDRASKAQKWTTPQKIIVGIWKRSMKMWCQSQAWTTGRLSSWAFLSKFCVAGSSDTNESRYHPFHVTGAWIVARDPMCLFCPMQATIWINTQYCPTNEEEIKSIENAVPKAPRILHLFLWKVHRVSCCHSHTAETRVWRNFHWSAFVGHGRVTQRKSFTSSASSIFLWTTYLATNASNERISESIEAKYWICWPSFWRLKSVNTNCENCPWFRHMCSNRWLKLEVTAQHKKNILDPVSFLATYYTW